MLQINPYFKLCIIPIIYLNTFKITLVSSDEPILPNPSVFESPPTNLARGRQYYEELKTKVQYSDCWAESLKMLTSGCSKMCDEEQRRIAYQFTYCHMKASGRSLPEKCPMNEPIKMCTEKLPDLTFNVYTEFFTHVHDICYHLQQTHWQQQTENTVQKLASSSLLLSQQLEESENLAMKTLEYQKSVDVFTEKLVENEKIQKTAFEELREWIKSDVVKGLTNDIMSIHSSIHEHSKTAGTILYYSIVITLTFIVTGASVATLQARTPMLIILIITFGIKQYQGAWLEDKLLKLNTDIGLARKMVLTLNLLVLLWESLRYRDIEELNNELLKKMFSKVESLNDEVRVLKKKVEENVGDTDFTENSISYQNHVEVSDSDYNCSDSDVSSNEIQSFSQKLDLDPLSDVLELFF